MREITRLLNIDSAFRPTPLQTTPDDHTVALPDDVRNVREMRVEDVTVPPVFRNVSRSLGNRTLVLRVDMPALTQDYAIKLPDGLYGDGSVANRGFPLERAMNAAMRAVGVTDELVFTIDPVSRRSAFGLREPAVGVRPLNVEAFFDVDDDGNTAPSAGGMRERLGWILGFRTAAVKSGAPANVAVVSQEACYLPLMRYMFVCVDDGHNEAYSSFVGNFDGSLHRKSILARLRMDDTQCDRTKVVTSVRSYTSPVKLSRLRLSLTDDLGRAVDLDGSDWSIVLSVRCVADH